jgi:hypothetical protein
LGVVEGGQGGLDPAGGEGGREPGVEGGGDGVLADVDGEGMVDAVGQGVFLRVAAAVVGVSVVPVALHALAALLVEHQAAQQVGMLGARGADPL